MHYCSWGAGGQLTPVRLRGAGAVLLRHREGGLENTAYGDARVELCRLSGTGEAASWLCRLRATGTAAVWGPSPNQKLPPWLLCSLWVSSRKASWLSAFLVSISLLCTSGRQRRERLGCLFMYTRRVCCTVQAYGALTPPVYEITKGGKND